MPEGIRVTLGVVFTHLQVALVEVVLGLLKNIKAQGRALECL